MTNPTTDLLRVMELVSLRAEGCCFAAMDYIDRHGRTLLEAMRDAERWREVADKREPGVRYGCHCDLDPDQEPDACVIDSGEPHLCVHAEGLACKEQCPYWRPIAARQQELAHAAGSGGLTAETGAVRITENGDERPTS